MVSPGRVAFTVFGFDIMWYGITMGSAIVIACAIGLYLAEREGVDTDKLLDVLLICVPVAIVGARLYYVAFEWEHYAGDLMAIINIRKGGLAIHGSLIFGIGTGAILCKAWNLSIPKLIDITAVCVPLAQSIGRWGNFFNEEAHGGPTDFVLNVLIDGKTYHATFLYEAMWCYALFVFLILMYNRGKKFSGQLFCLYAMLYSAERYLVEGLRTDSLMIGPMRQAQMLSLTIIAIAGVIYLVLWNKNRKRAC